MNKSNLKVEAVSTINYQFTAIPTNLFYLLDNNTRTLLFCLIQSSTYFAKEDGFFYITKEAIGELTNLSVNVITAAIDTLYINGLVYVQTVGKSKGKYVNHYRVNFEEFRRFEDYTIEELKNPSNKIEMVKYKNNYQPQYIKDYLDSNNEGKQVCKEERKEERKKVITNIDNIDNINNIENKDNINNIKNNIDNNIINKIEEKENNIINDVIKEKEVNLNKIEILEIEENIVNMDNLENVKNKFYFNLNLLVKKMKGLTKEEIKQKLVLLNNWIKNHSYFKFLQENEMNDELDNITSIVQKGLNEIRKEMKNDITVTSTPLDDINTSTDENNTSTLEEIKTIESFCTPNSLFNTSSTSTTDDLDYSQWDKEKYQFPWNDPECERRKQQYQQTHYIKTDVYYI